MVAQSGSLSPSAHKPAQVLKSWQGLGIPLDVRDIVPVTPEDYYRAHDFRLVQNILAGRAQNGFGNCSLEVAASLPYTSGSMLCAAREALSNKQVAVAPCSGFHHAEWNKTMGFCTFNGLMVTALALHAEMPDIKVGILDFDQHYGNGTDNIMGYLKAESWITHYTAGKEYGSRVQDAEPFLRRIPSLVQSMADCNVILYQAGADPHVDDPYGGFLTTAQLYRRDQIVFRECRRLGVPICWNLAGGYSIPLRKVLDIHDNTMTACAQTYLPA